MAFWFPHLRRFFVKMIAPPMTMLCDVFDNSSQKFAFLYHF